MSGASSPPVSVDRSMPRALLPSSLVFADTPSRIVAYFLDGLVVSVMYAIPLAIFGFYDVATFEFPDRGRFVVVTVLIAVIQAAYFTWFWTGGRRATPGQRLFSIQVGHAFDGQPLSVRQAVVRYLAFGTWITLPFVLPFRALGFASLACAVVYNILLLVSTVVSPTKRGLQDRFAGSAVVRPAHAERVWAKRVIWAVLVIAALYVALFAVVFLNAPNGSLPTGYWDSYLDWLWPS